ncbi:MAG: SAM-dependent methyltransferase [Streptosporangiaceae bacterium]
MPAQSPDRDNPIEVRYPNTARIWNYQLGGTDNFAVDREASEAANAMVRAMGVPSGANTAVESRHLQQRVLGDARVRELFDFAQPVGVMFMCVLHCLWDSEDPWAVVGQFRDAVAPGSYVALSHMTDEAHPEAAEGLFRMTQDLHWNTPLISRNRAGIARFFDGFTLVEPGLVRPAQWRPDLDDPLRSPAGDDEPVLKPGASGPAEDDRGTAWHLVGVGLKSG